MASEFEIGDIVRMKTGGRLMVVSKIDGTIITCVYSNEGQRKTQEFKADISLLEKLDRK